MAPLGSRRRRTVATNTGPDTRRNCPIFLLVPSGTLYSAPTLRKGVNGYSARSRVDWFK